MSSTAINFSANSGLPGEIAYGSTVETWIFDPLLVPAAFGVPVKKTAAGKIAEIEAGDVVGDFYGILGLAAPSVDGSLSIVNLGQPNGAFAQSVCVGGPGYVKVACTVGTPVKGGDVYMRIVEALPKLIGDFEADADGVNSVLLPNVFWNASDKDAGNVTDVKVN